MVVFGMILLKSIDFIALATFSSVFFFGLKYSVATIIGWISAFISGGYESIMKRPASASSLTAEIYQFLGEALFYGVVYFALMALLLKAWLLGSGTGEFTLILAGIMLLKAPDILHNVDNVLKGNKTTAFR